MVNRKSVMLSFAIVFVLFSCFLLVGARRGLFATHASSKAEAKSTARLHKDRKPAPDFTLKDSNGASITLSDYHGKVVLLNFWATWCGPCQLEIPWFVEFEQEFKSRGFEIVGVSMDDDGWDAVKPYLAQRKVNYRILLANDQVTQLYGGLDALPTTFIIDRDGKIAAVHVGLAGKNEYLNEIESLLDSKQQTSTLTSSLRSMPSALLASAAPR